jgi:nicotinate-nucleotide adenylyltransferase
MPNKRIGLFFGSFNPIHNGHLILASLIQSYASLDEVWLVVSPHNPHKPKKSLLNQNHRLFMIQKAIENHPYLRASSIEFSLPTPNYTINTLVHIQEKNPNDSFHLIMGMDNLSSFQQWKSPNEILDKVDILVYPRLGSVQPDWSINHPKIILVPTPIIELSSTEIRKRIKENKSISFFVPETVEKIINKEGFYCG